MKQLPIDAVLPELLQALRDGTSAVLVAEPGAGKTTRVPLALLHETWLDGRKIVMLEPRRLAARSAAKYMASSLGEQVGETVGYRVRLDTKVSAKTRIEVVTEGVLTRMLQEDQALEEVGAVLFDEFHERHLHGDLGLALALQSQSLLRENLRLIVMSATLDAEPVAKLLGGAPVIQSRGRAFPVETVYRSAKVEGRIEPHVASAIADAIRNDEGDVLVFLPGVGEIRRTAGLLAQSGHASSVRIAELHGNLPLEAQDAAVAPCKPGERKVVLSTSIAESSLTVEGIRIVVDCGLMRVPRFSPRTGMTRLETVPVSQASADQRRGRAGRLAPGVCYRLWTEQEHAYLPQHNTPELLEADLAPLALELSVWGAAEPGELMWLDAPPQAAYRQALELLKLLQAIDADGRITSRGTRMAKLGLHPRLGFMLLKAAELNLLKEACELAGLLSERDLLPQERNVDVALRLDALHGAGGRPMADRGAVQRIKAQAKQWQQMVADKEHDHKGKRDWKGTSYAGLLIALAYPDRIAQKRPDGRYLLANGRGAVLPELQPLSRSAFLAAAELDDAGSESRIRLAAELELDMLEQAAGEQFQAEDSVEWDSGAQAVRARRRVRLGAIILKEAPIQQPSPEQIAAALADGIAGAGLGLLPMSKAAWQLQARMRLMAHHNSGWPDVSEEALRATVRDWLLPHLYGMKSKSDLQRLNMVQLLEGMLSWGQRQELDEQVPTHMTVPSGSRIPIDYSDPEAPFIAVRLQELFGLRETPRLAGGKLPLTLHLLSPSQRPVQVTRDLRSFWNEAYFEVKKDLKGRYPKHYWPDDPYAAQPTNRVRPRT
ncbi:MULTISPECIES: ATP-dependent helicase HrpB [unclassified Paenibacillus]|uniref:ATP-dependent helicase HrpB n=1 Tax=unclassified Paenibacillus TaxID=185978 RepID=UPI001048B920|nr:MULTISPECIES: ATP-dependent helicase HrpB [unclassified Paenibacillus]NIK68936.1 ATP-dependent helicase HrpB [Paenibacillus sp. BK720]TCM98791.1 ATP-dependent helicase HrpB [Paenibacillus sp. BK033]